MKEKTDESRALKMRTQYLGVLSLLASCSVQLRSGDDTEETRSMIVAALRDAQKLIPALRWRRVLNSIEVEIV